MKLRYEEIPIKAVRFDPMNPNKLNKKLMEALEQEIKKRGFIQPVVVRKTDDGVYQMIDGEHRTKVAEKIGMDSVPAIILEDVDEKTARILLVNLNRIKGEFDDKELSEIFEYLEQQLNGKENLIEELYLDEREIELLNSLTKVDQPIKESDYYHEYSDNKEESKVYKVLLKFDHIQWKEVKSFIDANKQMLEEEIIKLVRKYYSEPDKNN